MLHPRLSLLLLLLPLCAPIEELQELLPLYVWEVTLLEPQTHTEFPSSPPHRFAYNRARCSFNLVLPASKQLQGPVWPRLR